jgi:hypothetical protein
MPEPKRVRKAVTLTEGPFKGGQNPPLTGTVTRPAAPGAGGAAFSPGWLQRQLDAAEQTYAILPASLQRAPKDKNELTKRILLKAYDGLANIAVALSTRRQEFLETYQPAEFTEFHEQLLRAAREIERQLDGLEEKRA